MLLIGIMIYFGTKSSLHTIIKQDSCLPFLQSCCRKLDVGLQRECSRMRPAVFARVRAFLPKAVTARRCEGPSKTRSRILHQIGCSLMQKLKFPRRTGAQLAARQSFRILLSRSVFACFATCSHVSTDGSMRVDLFGCVSAAGFTLLDQAWKFEFMKAPPQLQFRQQLVLSI